MDINKVLHELYEERRRIDQRIAALEKAQSGVRPGGRVWNAEARRAAAERMRLYWEKRRQQALPKGGATPEP